MGEVLKKFGRYFLLDHIAQGGMAEIYRARLASLDGAGRLLVIKRIQPGFGANAEFIKMFRSEIKVTMSLNHPNIVQVYDFGEEQSQPYIAMEFVDGKSLRQFLARNSENKLGFPVEIACYIISQVAGGLFYAHNFKEKLSGESLNIVHRDISPQNILISYDGNVKIIDFGIAKAATTTSEMTRAGVIKGKPSYLSPEQINGDELDGRCDIFGLGIVLWELLTGRKLFSGENDLAVLKLIESCNTHVKPPSTLNPDIPKELDYIVLKALAKQPEKRYQTGEELQRALSKFIFSRNPDFDPKEISMFSKNIFKNEIVEDRKHIQKLNEKAQKLLEADTSFEPASRDDWISKTRKEDTSTLVEQRTKVSSLRNIDSHEGGKVKVEIENSSFLKTLDEGSIPSLSISDFRVPKVAIQNERQYQRPTKTIHTQIVKSSGRISWLISAIFVTPIVLGAVYYFSSPEISLPSPKTSEVSIPQREPGAYFPSKKSIPLRLSLKPWTKGARLTLNGKRLDLNNPGITIDLDAPLELIAESNGFKKHIKEFTVTSNEAKDLKEYPLEIQFEPEVFGFLTLKTIPSADLIFINGEDWRRRTPIINEKLPVGAYTIRAINEVLQMENTFNITINESKSLSLEERLEIKK